MVNCNSKVVVRYRYKPIPSESNVFKLFACFHSLTCGLYAWIVSESDNKKRTERAPLLAFLQHHVLHETGPMLLGAIVEQNTQDQN